VVELTISSDEILHEKSCISNAGLSRFKIDKGPNEINLLTNKKNGEFTITGFEVWEVFDHNE
jgi:hypothetical protein